MLLVRWFQSIINTGTGSIKDPEKAKQIRLTNLMALTVFTTGSPFSIVFYIYGSKLSAIVLVLYILSFLIVFWLNKKESYFSAKIFMLFVMNIAVIHLSIWYGVDAALHRMLMPFGCIPFLIFNRTNYLLITFFTSLSFLGYLAIDFIPFSPLLMLDELSISIVYHGLTCICCTWIILEMLYLSNQNFLAISLLTQQRKDQTNAIVHAQESERTRIARDLHDSFGQLLSAIKINLEMVGPQENHHLKTSKDLVDSAVIEMKNVAYNLMPGTLENNGLIPAISELIGKIKRTAPFEVFYYVHNIRQQDISKDQQHNIYRIIQEGLHNILKHAKATEVNLQLVNSENKLTITLEDNGCGFDLEKVNRTGSGLQNMKARTEWLDGEFMIDSGAEIGTTIIVSIPTLNISSM